jgi:peptidylprolyl isomerase
MKKILILTLAALPALVSAQKRNEKVKPKESETVKTGATMKTSSGLEYTITQKGQGKKPLLGDKVVVHYTGRLTNDTVFDSSLKRGQPFTFKLGAGQVIQGWDEAFQLLEVGDKATIKFGPELGYGSQNVGTIPANSTLIFDVELLDIIEGLRPWEAEKMDTITTASGLKYIHFLHNPNGKKAERGSKVIVHYTGFFKDGKIFDSSVERGQPISVKVGMGQVIQGWDEGLALLHKGEKAKFIIPYQLAYGEQGRPPVIPEKSDLIFDVELLDVQEAVVIKPYDTTGLQLKKTETGLQYFEVKHNDSTAKAEKGKTVKVHYTGYLADGKVFDSSVERGEPIEFPLGQGYVIPGWDEGIALMRVGDKLRLVIPYALAYGEQGRPPVIPAKADLTFDVELIEVK